MTGDLVLNVEIPPSFEPERRYVLSVLFEAWLGLHVDINVRDRADTIVTHRHRVGDITFVDGLFGVSAEAWLSRATLPLAPLDTWVAPDLPTVRASPIAGQSFPALFRTPEPATVALALDGRSIRFNTDLLGSAFFMLSRYEEVVVPDRDEYDRFPEASALAIRAGFHRLPIVDALTELLWAALAFLWPELERAPTKYELRPTHDVDLPYAGLERRIGRVLRSAAADVVKRSEPGLAVRRVAASIWPRSRLARDRDPFDTFDFLMSTTEATGLRSSFYVLSRHTAPNDTPYRLDDPRIVALLRSIAERGHEVGLHGSFDSYLSGELLSAEFHDVRAAAAHAGVDQSVWGGRQHFLRWRNPETWRVSLDAGLDYDSTLGFATDIGFRAGTSREFPVYDLKARTPTTLVERPLIVMDTSLSLYMQVRSRDWLSAIEGVASECRRYRAPLVILWHNSSIVSTREQRSYRELVQAIA